MPARLVLLRLEVHPSHTAQIARGELVSVAQAYAERCAAPFLAFDFDHPPVLIHDTFYHRESDAHAARAGREERVEKAIARLGADAWSVVVNLEHGWARTSRLRQYANRYTGAGAACLHGVAHEV